MKLLSPVKMKNKALRTVLALALSAVLALELTGPVKVMAASSYTYTVRVFAGAQGTINGGDVYTISNLKYGDEVDLHDVVSLAKPNNGSKYYVKGIRESGRDNTTVGPLNLEVYHDIDLVVTYALKSNIVTYKVRYLEEGTKQELHDPDIYEANIGDKVVGSYRYINGYRPKDHNQTITINSANEYIDFWYTKNPTSAAVSSSGRSTRSAANTGTSGGTGSSGGTGGTGSTGGSNASTGSSGNSTGSTGSASSGGNVSASAGSTGTASANGGTRVSSTSGANTGTASTGTTSSSSAAGAEAAGTVAANTASSGDTTGSTTETSSATETSETEAGAEGGIIFGNSQTETEIDDSTVVADASAAQAAAATASAVVPAAASAEPETGSVQESSASTGSRAPVAETEVSYSRSGNTLIGKIMEAGTPARIGMAIAGALMTILLISLGIFLSERNKEKKQIRERRRRRRAAAKASGKTSGRPSRVPVRAAIGKTPARHTV